MNGSTDAAPPGQWTADELMHGKAGEVSPPTSPNGSATSATASVKKSGRFSMKSMKSSGKKSADPMDWGMPGHMTKEEVDVFVSQAMFCTHKKMPPFFYGSLFDFFFL
jgi:hypothetical protein